MNMVWLLMSIATNIIVIRVSAYDWHLSCSEVRLRDLVQVS